VKDLFWREAECPFNIVVIIELKFCRGVDSRSKCEILGFIGV
jgi:hypothetical protein